MAAGPVASKCLQTGPSEYPEAPGMLPGREGLIVKDPGKGLQVQKCLQTITTYTYSSTKAASSKWLQGLLVRTACKQVHQSIQRLQACWQAKRALIVKQPGKGLHVRNVCRQSLHVHIQVQRLQVRNGCRACRFEMPAGSKWPSRGSRGSRYKHQYIFKYI